MQARSISQEKKMKPRIRFERWLVAALAILLFSPAVMRLVIGAAAPRVSATTTFQRAVDTPSPGPLGTVKLVMQPNGKETFEVNISKLEGQSFGLFFGEENTFNTNTVFLIGPLSLVTNGHWKLHYEAVGHAPPQLPVAHLDDLEGLFLFVSNPSGDTNVTGCVTNITDCTLSIVGGVTNFDNCVTNITGCVTNPVVSSVLVAQVPPLTAKPQIFSHMGRSLLTTDEMPNAPPSLNAMGTVTVKFSGSTGVSMLDIRASRLAGGQSYSLWFSTEIGGSTYTNVASLTPAGSPKVAFTRNTKMGETLPMLASTVTNLSGRNIQIRDAFDLVHLQGTIP
jgi:hypothetical protein